MNQTSFCGYNQHSGIAVKYTHNPFQISLQMYYILQYLYGFLQILDICDNCLNLEYQCHTINKIMCIKINAAKLLPVKSITAPTMAYDITYSYSLSLLPINIVYTLPSIRRLIRLILVCSPRYIHSIY